MREWILAQVPPGIEVLLFLQDRRGPVGDVLFKLITDLGSGPAILIIIAIIWWCVSKEVGSGLADVALGSFYVNGALKNLFRIPRPFAPAFASLNYGLVPLRHEVSYSWPSGHAQNAVALWGYLAYRLRRWQLVLPLCALPLLIGFSRLYLGVHTYLDVLSGWGVGVLCLVGGLWSGPRVEVGTASMRGQIVLAGGVLILLILLAPFREPMIAAGALIGLRLGRVLEGRYVRFSVRGRWWQRILRPVVGLVVLLPVYVGVNALLPVVDRLGPMLGLCFVPAGLVVAWMVPWVFVRLRLAATL